MISQRGVPTLEGGAQTYEVAGGNIFRGVCLFEGVEGFCPWGGAILSVG